MLFAARRSVIQAKLLLKSKHFLEYPEALTASSIVILLAAIKFPRSSTFALTTALANRVLYSSSRFIALDCVKFFIRKNSLSENFPIAFFFPVSAHDKICFLYLIDVVTDAVYCDVSYGFGCFWGKNGHF